VGYRVLAYRNDNYVDVYDDPALNHVPEESFSVAEKGSKNHKITKISNVNFYKDGLNVFIEFEFKDIRDRIISVYIRENSSRNSRPINMLAPIGADTDKPNYLPLFFLYDFDFVRRAKTEIIITIDGKRVKVDKFPFPTPKDMQLRFYTRYSLDTQLIEFNNTEDEDYGAIDVFEDGVLEIDNNIYKYVVGDSTSLKSIHFISDNRDIKMTFNPVIGIGIDKDFDSTGIFEIHPDKRMGVFKGRYKVSNLTGVYKLQLDFDCGWEAVPNSMLTKILFKPSSIFCSWPKQYSYNFEFYMHTRNISKNWNKRM
jgi:hypothetical protein